MTTADKLRNIADWVPSQMQETLLQAANELEARERGAQKHAGAIPRSDGRRQCARVRRVRRGRSAPRRPTRRSADASDLLRTRRDGR